MRLHRPLSTTALSLVLASAVGGAALAQDSTMRQSQRIDMTDWGYETLYRDGESVRRMMDMDVDGVAEEDIGEVEDLILSPDGEVLAVIVEVGGFWDIGDTHVSVPWDEVQMNAVGDGIVVPLNEDNVGEYSLFDEEILNAGIIDDQIVTEVDDAVSGQRAWRASELIGDYARVQDEDAWENYGYVSDIILQDGRVESVVITPDASYGVGGYYAMPYYGYGTGYGWTPGATRYDMPYSKVELEDLQPFEYERMGAG